MHLGTLPIFVCVLQSYRNNSRENSLFRNVFFKKGCHYQAQHYRVISSLFLLPEFLDCPLEEVECICCSMCVLCARTCMLCLWVLCFSLCAFSQKGLSLKGHVFGAYFSNCSIHAPSWLQSFSIYPFFAHRRKKRRTPS